MKKHVIKAVCVAVSASMLLSGCVYDGAKSSVRLSSYDPDIGEREGLAMARILTSPLNMVGHTYGEYERWGKAYPIGIPFIPLVSIPSGCLAACMDILTGTSELISFQQFKGVSYSWESFDKDKSDKWATPVVVTYAVAAMALVAWAEAEEAKKHQPPPPPPGGCPPPPPPPPR